MKVGIITLPLHTNYGGLLQAYALKKVIEELGHQAFVLDPVEKMKRPSLHAYLSRMLKRMLVGSKGPEVFREKRFRRELPLVGVELAPFISSEIDPVALEAYSKVRDGEYDAFVVGSDQVWRPVYFGGRIEDAFLAFAEGYDVRRIAYAASFGTDKLEYEYTQLETCSRLLKRFDAVSVREASAVAMCAEWFEHEGAVHVADPVLLLSVDTYSALAAKAARRPCKGKVMSYILDDAPEKQVVVEKVAKWTSCDVHDASVRPYDRALPVAERVVPSMSQWLSCFEDAEFVVTDSFHACVLAILFHKPFIVLGNVRRGLVRFASFLEMAGLEQRLVQGIDPEDDGRYWLEPVDWAAVDAAVGKFRNDSISFLADSLDGVK